VSVQGYLSEHATAASMTLSLAHKEAEHLRYSHSTLFAYELNLSWVENLKENPQLAEKVEAFVSRFGRLQDHLGDKLIPRYAQLVGEKYKTQIDVLSFAERAGVLTSADEFLEARKLRNSLVHEYMKDSQSFLDSLNLADTATKMLFDVINKIQAEFQRLGLNV
jgi:hypothetical protein